VLAAQGRQRPNQVSAWRRIDWLSRLPPWAGEIPPGLCLPVASTPSAMTRTHAEVSTIWKPCLLRADVGVQAHRSGAGRPCASGFNIEVGLILPEASVSSRSKLRGCWSKPITASGQSPAGPPAGSAQCLAFWWA